MFLFLLLCYVPFVFSNKSINYLSQYGYIQEDALSDDISSAVKLFQKTYGLLETGYFTQETLDFMDKPRCGNKDDLQTFVANPNRKWSNNAITWYMLGGNRYDSLVQRAFDLWAKHSRLIFRKDSNNPNIYLSFSARKHVHFSRRNSCPYDFDGPGLVLAHAFLPVIGNNQSDIHFDNEESWAYHMNLPRYNETSLYLVLVHEIGHALGLSHSFVKDSIMWPQTETPTGISNLYEYDLSTDDILAIQFLYGRPQADTPTTTLSSSTSIELSTTQSTTTQSTTTQSTTPSTSTTVASKSDDPVPITNLDICSLRREVDQFLIVKDKIFVFYRKYVWIIHLNPSKRIPGEYTHPKILTDWLPFLPKHFTRITAVYQRPNGEIVIFVEKEMYFIKYPELNLLQRMSINSITGKRISKVNAVVNNNHGNTLILIDDGYVVNFDECRLFGNILGTTSNVLLGVPGNVKSGFRYTNGRVYFLTNNTVLEYNEFINTVTKSDTDAFDVLQISCMRESLLRKLYDIIMYLQ